MRAKRADVYHHFQQRIVQLRVMLMANSNNIVQGVCDGSVCRAIGANNVGISGCVEKPGFQHYISLGANDIEFVDVKCDCDIRQIIGEGRQSNCSFV